MENYNRRVLEQSVGELGLYRAIRQEALQLCAGVEVNFFRSYLSGREHCLAGATPRRGVLLGPLFSETRVWLKKPDFKTAPYKGEGRKPSRRQPER